MHIHYFLLLYDLNSSIDLNPLPDHGHPLYIIFGAGKGCLTVLSLVFARLNRLIAVSDRGYCTRYRGFYGFDCMI